MDDVKTNLLSMHPNLAAEWHPYKNGDLRPEDFTIGSHKKVVWLGQCGHEWNASIKARINGTGCPYCSGSKVLIGFNDLKTKYPDIVKEWDYQTNESLPESFSPGSHKKVNWIDRYGHTWNASIKSRVRGTGCPYCSNNKILAGFNDLASVRPDLMEEWDYEKNSLNPKTIAPGSGKKAWWKCKNGHEWYAEISSRNKGHGCPKCFIQKSK